MSNTRWIRPALLDRGYQQKNIAQSWGVTHGQVSRFINYGHPELTLSRAVVLADMLGMDVNSLAEKIHESA